MIASHMGYLIVGLRLETGFPVAEAAMDADTPRKAWDHFNSIKRDGGFTEIHIKDRSTESYITPDDLSALVG